MHNLVLSPIDPDVLVDKIANKVIASLIAAGPKNERALDIVDEPTLARKIDVTRQTLARWRKQGRIPYLSVGGLIRYDLAKVVDALEKKKGGSR